MADDRERLKGNLDLLLLSVLARGPAHGYAVIAALRQTSDGAFNLPEGTVYPALHRLERSGLLSADWHRATTPSGSDPASGRRRKVYALTADGEAALAAERARWRRFRTGMGAVLDARGTA
jgi:PadR family transcriptional regulator PadR